MTREGRGPKVKRQPSAGQPPRNLGEQTERRPSLVRKPLIAFAPLDEEIPTEILELEETLEHEYDPIPQHGDQKVSVENEEKEVSVVHAVVTPAPPVHSIGPDKRGEKGERSFYDHLPRPYLTHAEEIKSRREKKMMDMMHEGREQYEYSEKDRRVKIGPSGTLIFHVLELFHIAVNTTSKWTTLSCNC